MAVQRSIQCLDGWPFFCTAAQCALDHSRFLSMRYRSRDRFRPGFSIMASPKQEGAGNAGCTDRTRSLVCNKKAHECSHHRYAEQSDIPCVTIAKRPFASGMETPWAGPHF
jgi:hypothetical protein